MFEQFKGRGRALFLPLQHHLQVILCVYALRHSYVAITNLQKYEEASKKAAEWSDEAQKQLTKTRTTQAAGLITVCLHLDHNRNQRHADFTQTLACLLSALSLILLQGYMSPWTRTAISPTMLLLVIGARRYIKGFWAPATDSKGKDQGTRIPLPKMGDYNLAVEKTEDLLKCLEYLEYSWVLTSLFGLAPGR